MKHRQRPGTPEHPASVRRDLPRYDPAPERGLTSRQVQELLEGGWGNAPVEAPTKTDGRIVRENIFTYFNLIFLVLAVCLLLVGDWKDMSLMMGSAGMGMML